VFFASGSKSISAEAQSSLRDLARNGAGLTGYLIEVKGYADPTENASTKQKLSRDRAGDCRFVDPELQLPVQAHGHRCNGDGRTSRFQRKPQQDARRTDASRSKFW
jgi:hypothetical protein